MARLRGRESAEDMVGRGLPAEQLPAFLSCAARTCSPGSTATLVRHDYQRPLMPHQMDLTDSGLTYHYQIWAAEMGTGKTLSAQELIERSGVHGWFWIGPKTSLPNVKREFRIWKFPARAIRHSVLHLRRSGARDRRVARGPLPPHGLICDESSRLKNASQPALAGRATAGRHDPREVGPGARLRRGDVRHAVAQDARGLVEPVRDCLARIPA